MKKIYIFVILLSFLTLTGCWKKEVPKQETITPKKEAQKLKNGIYTILSDESEVIWSGEKIIGSSHKGNINIKEGHFLVTNEEITGGEAIINMTTISESEKNEKLVEHLFDEDFFNIEKYPDSQIILSSSQKIETITSGDKYKMKGNLRIKNISNQVEFEPIVKFDENNIYLTSEIKIDRTKWDIKFGSNKFEELGDSAIKDEIVFEIKLKAKVEEGA